MIMIVKTPGSQVGSPTVAEKGGEVRGGGKGGGWRENRSAIEVDGAKSETKIKTGEAMHVAQRMSGKSPSLASSSLSLLLVVTALTRTSACLVAASTFMPTLVSSLASLKQGDGRHHGLYLPTQIPSIISQRLLESLGSSVS